METKVISMDQATFDQWQSIGLVEGLVGDQEIATFLIQQYDVKKEQASPPLLCSRCHAPLTALCDVCRLPTPSPHQPPPCSSLQPSHNAPLPNANSSLLSAGSLLSEGGKKSQTRISLSCHLDQSHPTNSLVCENRQSPKSTLVAVAPQLVTDQSESRSRLSQSGNSQSEHDEDPGTFWSSDLVEVKSSEPLDSGVCPSQHNGPVPEGEDWCKQAQEKNLLSPRIKGDNQSGGATSTDMLPGNRSARATSSDVLSTAHRKTRGSRTTASLREPQEARRTRSSLKRSRGLSSNQTEPQDTSNTVHRPQQVGGELYGRDSASKRRTLQQSRRPGLRSSGPVLKEEAADWEEGEEETSAASPDGEGERKEAATPEDLPPVKQEDCASPTDARLLETLTSGDNDDDDEDEEKPVLPSQQAGELPDTTDLHTPSPGSQVSWHYLGVADVDLPDGTQKRKSFKRSPNDRYQCKECSSSFTHRGILVKHIRLAHLKWRPHRCHACSAAYATKTKLVRHVTVAHTKLRPFRCETCGASFVDQHTLQGHQDTHAQDRQYRFFCELCGKGYYGMRELKRHMETHATRATRSLLCWVCGKAVRTTQYLRIHLRTHCPDKAFRCGDCGHVFTSKCALHKHQTSTACRKRIHNTKGPTANHPRQESRTQRVASLIRNRRERKVGSFQCDLCHKYFSAKKNIYKHKRSVHGVEARRESDNRILVTDPTQIARYFTPKKRDAALLKFSCDICSRRYSSQESVRKHKNIVHFGRRDYKCDLCDKTFTRHTSVIEHKHNVHNPAGKSARPVVQCDICQKQFAARNSLRKHVKTVHFGLLPYVCGDCGKKFASRYHLREHLKTSGHTPSQDMGEGRGEEEGSGAGVTTTTTTTTTVHSTTTASPNSPVPQITDARCQGTTVTAVTAPSLTSIPTLPPLPPWAHHLPPASGAITPLQHMGTVGVGQGEVTTEGSSTGVRDVPPSFHLWSMG